MISFAFFSPAGDQPAPSQPATSLPRVCAYCHKKLRDYSGAYVPRNGGRGIKGAAPGEGLAEDKFCCTACNVGYQRMTAESKLAADMAVTPEARTANIAAGLPELGESPATRMALRREARNAAVESRKGTIAARPKRGPRGPYKTKTKAKT